MNRMFVVPTPGGIPGVGNLVTHLARFFIMFEVVFCRILHSKCVIEA